MERGVNCVKDVTTLPDGTSPGEEKVLKSVVQQFFCVNDGFSLGEIGFVSKMPFLGISCSRDQIFEGDLRRDYSTSRGVTNFKIFLQGLEGPYECGICQIQGCT